jgi:hypothetical protein
VRVTLDGKRNASVMGGFWYDLADLTNKVGRDRWARGGRPAVRPHPRPPHN